MRLQSLCGLYSGAAMARWEADAAFYCGNTRGKWECACRDGAPCLNLSCVLHHILQHPELKIAQRVSILCWHKPNFTPPFSSFHFVVHFISSRNNQQQPWNCLKHNKTNEMEINFFFFFLHQDYLPVWLLSSPAVYQEQKEEIILELMAEDSEPYCNH